MTMTTLAGAAAIAALALAAGPAAFAREGALDPAEGGITRLADTLARRPETAGFACRAVCEAQKGGRHAQASDALGVCARAGNAASVLLLSHACENGRGVARNDTLAALRVKATALRGHSTAQYRCGVALPEGRGVVADAGRAAFRVSRAAMAGDRDAAALLGGMARG